MLFSSQTVDAVEAAIRASGVTGRVAVLGNPRLAKGMCRRGRDVIYVSSSLRSLSRYGTECGARICGSDDRLPLADASVDVVVGLGLAEQQDWQATIDSWACAASPHGLIVMVDKAPACELSRRALCGGLTNVEQRRAGRQLVTSGRVCRL